MTEAEARLLATRDEILARRNPELLAREKAEFEAMTDAELFAIARLAPPASESRRACEDDYRAAWGVTQSTFIDTVRCTIEIVAQASGLPGGLRPVDLDGLAEACWQVFVDNNIAEGRH